MPHISIHVWHKRESSDPGLENDVKGENDPPPRKRKAESHRLSVAEHRSKNIVELREKARIRMANHRKLVNNDPATKEAARKRARENDARYRKRHQYERKYLQRIARAKKDEPKFTREELRDRQKMEEWAAENRWVQAMPAHMTAGDCEVKLEMTAQIYGIVSEVDWWTVWDPGTKDDPKGVWLVLNPNARHPGVGIYNSWPSAEAASSGIRGPGATWFSSVDTAVPAWHARCRLGVHNHPAEPTSSPVKAEASDITMVSPFRPRQNEEQSPPMATANSLPVHPSQSARVAFAHEYLKMPNHDPNSSCLVIRGRPEITAGTSHQAGTPTLDFRTPTRGSGSNVALTSPFSPTTPTKQGGRSSVDPPPSSASKASGLPSSPSLFTPTLRLFYAVQGGECVYSDRLAAHEAYHRQLDTVGYGNLCTTSNLTKATLVAAGHDVEQARVIMVAWEEEEREAARKEEQQTVEEAEHRARASAQRLADIAAGVAERKEREEKGKAARLAAILHATNGAPAAGVTTPLEGKDAGNRPPSPSASEGYHVGFDDLTDLDFAAIDGDHQPNQAGPSFHLDHEPSPPRPSFNPRFENGPRDDLGPGNWEGH
ncbi:hypothetical protein B0H11DRAFT_1938024 [Mycena galericulata]|nr:hypothetical protein B0H11DRAFT_1938021 [Mycena galericulata]KAJ7435040.1 hypothetical protein B0H11DRAFT_1938024 [Mycena galericulata]